MCSCKNHRKNLTTKKIEVKKIETVKYKTVLVDKKVKKLALEYLEN
jgi:hypothetical protein